MIDTHAHLTDPKLDTQVEMVLGRAKKAGVVKVIVPGTDLRDMWQVKQLTEKYEEVYGLAGIYPGNVDDVDDLDKALAEIESLLTASPKIVGIGEIGLDCYWTDRNIKKQREFFKAQLELAVRKNLPVAIHSRKSEGPIRETFMEMEKLPRGQFHCFGESPEFLGFILEKGFYVSFCGNITYKSADHLRQLARQVPLGRLLLETDSPYLAPEVGRNRPNEPANVKIIAEYIANLLDVPLETLINQTSTNAKCLFLGG